MSQTVSIGVVGPSYWSYMSAVMAERLEKEIRTKLVEPEDVPKSVYKSALRFFRLVLQAAGDTIPENPPASLNAYVIATKAVKESSKPLPKTDQELETCLRGYLDFVERLQKPRKLTKEELETAKALQKFFLQLKQQGEAEAYESYSQFQEPTVMRYRF